MTKDLVRPKNKNFKKQAGQILIIFLLILVVGLALVLSVASRSITDIRITTSTDESNRAYFAAEAGVEEALAQLQKDQDYEGGELNFTAINQTTARVNVSELNAPGAGAAFFFPEEFERDSVAQVNLLIDFNNIGSGNPLDLTAGDTLAVYYGSEDTGSEEPAIEVSIVHRSGAGVWGIKKFAFDSEVRGNGFCNVPAGTTDVTTQDGLRTFSHLASIDFINGYPAKCSGGPVLAGIGTDTAVLARIRLLYNDVPEPIAVGTEGSFTLPVQGSEVISTGSTVSGVTRKLRVTTLFPALPAIFDYVLFSGGDLVK